MRSTINRALAYVRSQSFQDLKSLPRKLQKLEFRYFWQLSHKYITIVYWNIFYYQGYALLEVFFRQRLRSFSRFLITFADLFAPHLWIYNISIIGFYLPQLWDFDHLCYSTLVIYAMRSWSWLPSLYGILITPAIKP